MKTKWYLAGKMSGIPSFNFPRFDAAADFLRSAGMTVINPSELDNMDTRVACMASRDGDQGDQDETWGTYLGRDVQIVADQVTGVILMDAWWLSPGARLEGFVAITCGHDIYELTPDNHLRTPVKSNIMSTIAMYTLGEHNDDY